MMTKPPLTNPAILLSTWFGLGYMKKAPGTWGSLGALPVGVLIFYAGGVPALLFATFAVTLIGFWAARVFDDMAETHDSKMIVIDEVAGMWIVLLAAGLNPVLIVLSFAFFRLFDVLKPWPICWLDRNVKGALGVMADDILAGVFAYLCIMGAVYVGIG